MALAQLLTDESARPAKGAAYRPLVSVVVPMFNASLTIPRALASIRAQSYPNWEAIFVDDASSDHCAKLIEHAGDKRCRVIRLDINGGPSRARNLGIAASRGELVAFLDADDEWLPEKLARQVAQFAGDPGLALVVADMTVRKVDGSEGSSVYARQAPVSGDEAWKTLLASSFIATSAVMTRRDLLDRIDGFDPGLVTGEDQDLFIRLALTGRVYALPEPLAVYHWMPRSYSTSHATRQARDVLAMVRRHLRVLGPQLSVHERHMVLARRYERLGGNLLDAGALLGGSWLLLRAVAMGRQPVRNLYRLLRGVLRGEVVAVIREPLVDLLPEDVVRILTARRDGPVSYRDCRVVGPLGVSPLSRLFRAVVPGLAVPLALKFCVTRDRRPDVEQARLQYAALTPLQRLARANASRLRLIHAFDLIPEHACVVMEWLEGRSVAAALASPMAAEDEIAFWSHSVGRWLRDFHAMHRLADRPIDCAMFLAQLDEEVAAAPKLRGNRSFAYGEAVLRSQAAIVAAQPVPVAQHHGDFKAENLMIVEGSLVGLDIGADWDDAVTLDLAKFLRDVTFRSWRPTGWLLGRRYATIVKGLLDGYGWPESGAAPLLWTRLHGLLRFWINLEAAPLDPIRETYGRYRFEQLVTELADTMERNSAERP